MSNICGHACIMRFVREIWWCRSVHSRNIEMHTQLSFSRISNLKGMHNANFWKDQDRITLSVGVFKHTSPFLKVSNGHEPGCKRCAADAHTAKRSSHPRVCLSIWHM